MSKNFISGSGSTRLQNSPKLSYSKNKVWADLMRLEGGEEKAVQGLTEESPDRVLLSAGVCRLQARAHNRQHHLHLRNQTSGHLKIHTIQEKLA
jgi:hypothetical protein